MCVCVGGGGGGGGEINFTGYAICSISTLNGPPHPTPNKNKNNKTHKNNNNNNNKKHISSIRRKRQWASGKRGKPPIERCPYSYTILSVFSGAV